MTSTIEPTTLKDGRVVAIAGPVVDIEFPHDGIPEINYAVEMTIDVGGDSVVVTAEVAQQLGGGRVRAVCLKPTDGLTRVALSTGIPVGFGLLTCDTEEQARDRCGLPDSTEDKGREAVMAAVDTALLLRKLRRGEMHTQADDR